MTLAALCLAVSLFLFAYPFAIYPLILRALPSRPAPQPLGPIPRRLALLVAVRDEEADLPRTLRNLRELHCLWPGLEILVWNDASEDGTGALLEAERGWMRVWSGERPVGKAAAIRRLMAHTDAEIVVMLDANIDFSPEQVLRFRLLFADPSVGAVGARGRATGGGDSFLGRLYWALEEWIKAEETRTGSTMGCDGGLWAIRRSLYPVFDPAQSDDFRPSMEALVRGYRVISDPGITYEEQAVADRRAAGRAWRIGCGAWHAHRAIWPGILSTGGRDRFKYVSHKLIRWFAALWLSVAAVSGLVLIIAGGILPEALGVLALAAVPGAAGIGPFRSGFRFLAIFAGTTAGVLHAIRGGRVERWSPIRSR